MKKYTPWAIGVIGSWLALRIYVNWKLDKDEPVSPILAEIAYLGKLPADFYVS